MVGQPAPAFTLTDSHGKSHSLASFQGKTVVLEWWNHECPFVAKHYGSANMQKLQKEWTAKGVVWLTVSSSAPGKQGYVDAAKANALIPRASTPAPKLSKRRANRGRIIVKPVICNAIHTARTTRMRCDCWLVCIFIV